MLLQENLKASIFTREIQKMFIYKSVKMLTLDISYPEIHLDINLPGQNYINAFYRREANRFSNYASTQLQKSAIQNYEYTLKNDFPFHAYDAVMKYTVTLNADCLLSTYFDQYEFTGGAHGNTIRSSSNWDLITGQPIEMEDLFEASEDYSRIVITQIINLANQQFRKNENIYFDDYKELIIKYFNPSHFNLNPEGITVYYQQYEIGPYVSGIITFDIPYNRLGIPSPGCKF